MHIERIYIIRHGQTDWNADGRWQGQEDVPLNGEGLLQARHLAKFLAARPIRHIFSSDLRRAMQTAQPLADALNLRVETDRRLREIHVGIFQGLTGDEVAARYPLQYAAFNSDKLNYVVPEGESRKQLQTRAFAAWEELVATAQGPEIALVSHGGTIKLLMQRLFESEAHALGKVRFQNTSITTLERWAGWWRVVGLGATPHLEHPHNDDSFGGL